MKADRPPLAEALRRARLARFTNQKDAAAHVRRETGVVGLTDSQWASYESGDPRRPFQQKHRDAIEQVLGPLADAPPVSVVPAASGDISELVAALDRQTDAIKALVAVVGRQATERPAWVDDALNVVLGADRLVSKRQASTEHECNDVPHPGQG